MKEEYTKFMLKEGEEFEEWIKSKNYLIYNQKVLESKVKNLHRLNTLLVESTAEELYNIRIDLKPVIGDLMHYLMSDLDDSNKKLFEFK